MRNKILWSTVILITILAFTMNTFAVPTQSDVNNMKNQLNNASNELKNIQNEKKSTMDEVAELTAQLQKIQGEINELQAQINTLTNNINTKQKEIEEKEQEIIEKQELLKKRLVSMYVNGQQSFLDILLGSSNYIEMLFNYDAVKEIADADTKLINEITSKKEEIEEEKKELETEKQKVDATKAQKDAKNTELSQKQSEKNAKVNQLTKEEKDKQAQIDKFNAAIRNAEEEIRRAAEEAKNKPNGGSVNTDSINNSAGTLGWPLPLQYAKHRYITSYFGPRPQPTPGASTNHGAIDVGVAYQPVYASEAGVIVTAGAVSGYGNFVMIWHKAKGELYTCYGHLSTILVKSGMTVKRGQQIAVSGNTGITTGPHLHFEVRSGGSSSSRRVDPLKYVSIS